MAKLFFSILCFLGYHKWDWVHNPLLDEEYSHGCFREVYERHCERCGISEYSYGDELTITYNNIKRKDRRI